MDQSFLETDDDHSSMNVRFVQQIKIRIGEAKNLQPKNGTHSLKECFCVINLDREEICRTHNSIDKTLHPFFGEEFCFDIPRLFHYLSIHLYERERSVNNLRNRPIGKVTIRRNQLKSFDGEESWFPIIPVNQSPDIQGLIHLEIEPQYILNVNTLRILISIFECQDIAQENCDSYAQIQLQIFDEFLTKKSKIKRKSSNPQFNESFCFEPKSLSSSSISSSSSPSSSSLPSANSRNANFDLNLGSLRLRISYIAEYVFSSHFYDSLRNILLSSIEIKPITSSIAYLLGEFVLNKADAAQPLVKFFLSYRKIVPLISFLAEDEISKISDVNTIFRGNSLVSKCIDELMKLVGIRYLHDTLKNCVEIVITENKCCEIDPTKIKDLDFMQIQMNNLKQYTALFFQAIISSVPRCPQVMRDVFSVLKELAVKFFPDTKDVCYYVISGFVFLRFFAPSILNPRLFELTDRKINSQVNRTFTLISKTIQSIGNLVVSKKNTPLIKENYMTSFYKEFITELHVAKTKEFLESISSPLLSTTNCSFNNKDVQEPVILKESIMSKKSNGGYKRIGCGTSFKKRYFCVTTQHFFYSKSKNKTPLYKFPINEITVKKSPIENYPIKNTFQVIHNKCTLHIQASNCVQERDWLDTLNRLIQLNNNVNNIQNNNCGTTPTANNSIVNNRIQSSSLIITNNERHHQKNQSLSFDVSMKLDCDQELARIHSLFISNLDNIRMVIRSATTENNPIVMIWKGNSKNYPSQFVIEDRCSLIQTLSALEDCICHLEKNLKQYVATIIGTAMAPIETEDC
ncbi:GTPase-activating protein-like protein [Sarcoptes scabiei]|uniref:GTPase-activating protein-like protein n=1 Tax=Sarcoptes scabiei TaxID=52283 RepID=A0A131ZXP7_SARSC|nr:GTPase-activating protein-like protein [Sarcoptes scabiei]